MTMSVAWPKHGPEFNRWNGDLKRLVELLSANAEDRSGWWTMDTPLKYLEIRVDTRDGGFVLRDRDGVVIQPERVEAAIRKWNDFLAAR